VEDATEAEVAAERDSVLGTMIDNKGREGNVVTPRRLL